MKTKSQMLLGLCFYTFIALTSVKSQEDEFLHGAFPSNFLWGFATASYQIEGADDVDGKGPNIWDTYTRLHPSPIDDNSTGEIACNSYFMYNEDVKLLRDIGAKVYRFSLSWSRILPTGKPDIINQKGIDYYNRLIDALLANGIEPMITMYHWDLPQPLQNIGGWPNEVLVQHFANFADIAFANFGDRVKYWITFNEPWVVCYQGYEIGSKAPGIVSSDKSYQCAHTIIKSHAKAYHIYEEKYRQTQNGLVGITLDVSWAEPRDGNNQSHVMAAERSLQFKHGWFASPLYWGKYPDVMREFVDRKSEAEGVPSRLPTFTPEESQEIAGTLDFLGLNHYTSGLLEPMVSSTPGWAGDQDTLSTMDESWPESAAIWLRVVPWGFRKILNWLYVTYNNPPIFVTENGFADYSYSRTNDSGRVNYYNEYINQMMKAVNLDGVNVTGYTAWSLMDNFEWARGYTQRFGIHYVDFEDPARPRIIKDSGRLLQKIIFDNGFPSPRNPMIEVSNNIDFYY